MSFGASRGPTIRNWAALALGVSFVLCGLLILPERRDIGIMTIAFFGFLTLVFAIPIGQSLRFRREPPLQVEIMGGVRIRPSRLVLTLVSACIVAVGAVIAVFGQSLGYFVAWWGYLTAILGGYLLLATAVGWLPGRYLQFGPSGVTFGFRRWSFMAQWDNIEGVAAAERDLNHCLLIHLREPGLVIVHPPERAEQVFKYFASNGMSYGAPIILNPLQYRMDGDLLVQALRRYIADPASRAMLSSALLENGVSATQGKLS